MNKSAVSQRSRLISILSVLFLLLVCITTSGIVFFIYQLPTMVAQKYGPSASNIDQSQKLFYTIQLYLNESQLLEPVDPAGQPKLFNVESGEKVDSIANRLQSSGLISSHEAFKLFLIYAGLDTGIQAGDYELNSSMSAVQIAYALQDATPGEIDFVILPGWRLEEIAASLPTSGLNISPEDFLEATQHFNIETIEDETGQVITPTTGLTSLEGYLFPDTYHLKREISLEELISTILQNFNQQISLEMREGFQKHGLELHQAVILASITQREAVIVDEQPTISSVFVNRLKIGMNLESDPTVQYALGYNDQQHTWWTNPLSNKDFEFMSPYNTYQSPGLPPGPISNPGLSALRSIAFVEETPYFYFRAACDRSGLHNFTITYEEHIQNACP